MTVEAARLYRFRATHSLPGFPEPWCHPHDHAYTVEVVGSFNHEQADERWVEIRGGYMDRDLNDVLAPTTVEKLAERFAVEFGGLVNDISQVTVWEDDDRWGRWTA